MLKKFQLFFTLLLGLSFSSAIAQEATPEVNNTTYMATPKHSWEVGVNAGHFFSSGDVEFDPSFGVGLHLRKAFDYIFSGRMDVMYGKAKGGNNTLPCCGTLPGIGQSNRGNPDQTIDEFESTYFAVTFQGIITLNNLKWDKPIRKRNLYIFAGAGPAYSNTDLNGTELVIEGRQTENWTLSLEAGAGLSFRLNERVNLGIEHKVATIFGKRTDFIDAYDDRWRDILNYTNIRLNININKKDDISEPLYWLNPLDFVLNDIAELKARPKLDLTDADDDGVVDMWDQELETPAGAPVNVKGIAMDSDIDGVKDYMDKEPHSPPGYEVDVDGIAQVPEPGYTTEPQVQALIAKGLKDYDLAENALVDWFIPMVHFNNDSYTIKRSEFEKLHHVATVLKNNPKVNVLVTGHTDQQAGEKYNEVLSYNRAKAAIAHLTSVYNVSADRLILNWGGEVTNLVPTAASNYMNRRVEFRVARKDDKKMERPEGPEAGKGTFKGNKDAGY